LQHRHKIAVITKIKKKLQGTEDTRNNSIIYSGVKQNIRKVWSDATVTKNTVQNDESLQSLE
jgi:hypothetical protein